MDFREFLLKATIEVAQECIPEDQALVRESLKRFDLLNALRWQWLVWKWQDIERKAKRQLAAREWEA